MHPSALYFNLSDYYDFELVTNPKIDITINEFKVQPVIKRYKFLDDLYAQHSSNYVQPYNWNYRLVKEICPADNKYNNIFYPEFKQPEFFITYKQIYNYVNPPKAGSNTPIGETLTRQTQYYSGAHLRLYFDISIGKDYGGYLNTTIIKSCIDKHSYRVHEFFDEERQVGWR